jgi:hypothetical protein
MTLWTLLGLLCLACALALVVGAVRMQLALWRLRRRALRRTPVAVLTATGDIGETLRAVNAAMFDLWQMADCYGDFDDPARIEIEYIAGNIADALRRTPVTLSAAPPSVAAKEDPRFARLRRLATAMEREPHIPEARDALGIARDIRWIVDGGKEPE